MALLQQQMHSPLLGTDGESRGVRRAATKRGEAKSKKKKYLQVYCCNVEAEQVVLGTALACP